MPNTSDLRPAEIRDLSTRLNTPEARRSATRALNRILNYRGHGSVTELHKALGVSRSTVGNWRDMIPGPDTVWRIAVAYIAEPNQVSARPDTDLDAQGRAEAAHLFDLFYSGDPDAALDWLRVFRPVCFTVTDPVAA